MRKLLTILFILSLATTVANNPFATGHYVEPERLDRGRFFATYYVRTTGNDANDGSLSNPWLTLSHAAATVTSGNLIDIGAGTFIETSTCVVAPGVSIVGAGNTTVIKSTITADFNEIISLKSATQGTDGSQSISNLKMDGDNLTTSWGICIGARSNVSIYNCEFIDFRETAVNFSGIAAVMDTSRPVTYATGNTFHDNIVYNCASNTVISLAKYGKGCLQFGGQQGFLCYNNDIQQPQRDSANNDDIGWPIKMANQGHIKGCKVYNNILKRAAMAATNGANQNWNFCFEMWYIHGGFEFYNNTCQGEVDLANLYKESYSFGMKFYGNTCSQPAINNHLAIGLRLETDIQDVEINGNVFYNINTAISFSPYDYGDGLGLWVFNINIHNNLFYNMGKTSGSDMAIMMDNTAVNTQCYFHDFYFDNNTVIAAAGAAAPFYAIQLPNYAGGNTYNVYCRNNHFQGFNQNPIIIGNGSHVYNVTIRNNNYYGNGTDGILIFAGGTPSGYTNSGHISVAPSFDGSYHPNVGSPLIDAGYDFGYPFNGTAPDIGYFETGGSGGSAPGYLKQVRGKKLIML